MKKRYLLPALLVVAATPASAQCDVDITNVFSDCLNVCDGFVTATPVSGAAPFTFQWSNGDQTPTADSLCLDSTYIITMTDLNGCVAYDTVTMVMPVITITSHFVTNTSCPTCCDGTDSVNVTTNLPDCMPLQYQWYPTESFPTPINFRNNLCAMSYTVLVTSSCMCNMGPYTFTFSSTVGADTSALGMTNPGLEEVTITQADNLLHISTPVSMQRVSLIDLAGRELYVNEQPGSEIILNLSAYDTPVIHLAVIYQNRRTVRTLVRSSRR
jgi:hypothetical protein